MAKFHGLVGYATTVTVRPGVKEEQITEVPYFGDVSNNIVRSRGDDKVLPDSEAGPVIEIVADAYAEQHFFAIRYVEWAGTVWTVESVTEARPRLHLRLGGVYNGPRPS